MGSCVSSPNPPSSSSSSSSVMKLKLPFRSKTENYIMPSPLKHNNNNNNSPIVSNFPNFGSKDETFFDSKAWLDSDCDDDFLSVNGEFTPSRGNTPLHHNFSTGETPGVNQVLVDDLSPGSKPEPSPTDKKPRLSDLFKDSVGGAENEDEQNKSGSLIETPYASSLQSSERTASVKPDKEKPLRSIQCCLPSLRSSFSERKKKTSPVQVIVK